MRCVNTYQDIKTPEEIEEEQTIYSIYQSLLREFDPDCGNYTAYDQWCRNEAKKRYKRYKEEEENA